MSKFDPVDYAMHYGSGRRDCAESFGTCSNGTPCDPAAFRAVVEHTLKAWAYGIKHGFMDNPFDAVSPLPTDNGRAE